MLEDLKANHDIVITLEDGQLDGDLVKKLQDFTEIQMLKFLISAVTKRFTDRVPLEELYQRYHLTKRTYYRRYC